MYWRITLYLLIGISLSGCFARYVDPTTGPMATILFKKNKQVNSDAMAYVEAKDCSGGRLRIVTPSDKEDKMIKVPAGKDFSFSMDLDMGWYVHSNVLTTSLVFVGCSPTVTFSPEANASYVAQVSVLEDKTGCEFSLQKTIGSENHVVSKPVPFQIRARKQGFDDSSSWCG